jgi:hypothetical protein
MQSPAIAAAPINAGQTSWRSTVLGGGIKHPLHAMK